MYQKTTNIPLLSWKNKHDIIVSKFTRTHELNENDFDDNWNYVKTVKSKFFETQSASLGELRQRIMFDCQQLNPEIFRNASRHLSRKSTFFPHAFLKKALKGLENEVLLDREGELPVVEGCTGNFECYITRCPSQK